MKQNYARGEQSLQNLVLTLDRQNIIKKDYFVKPSNMFLENGNLILTAENAPITFTPNKLFHEQVASYTNIPKVYYDRVLAENPQLLDKNVNYWFDKIGKARLVRTFQDGTGNQARAFLSDSYNIIDNYEVLFEALEALRSAGIKAEIFEADVTDTKMYLKIIIPDVEINAKEFLHKYARTLEVGTGIIAGYTISNSEVGKGQFEIAPRAHILGCNNGAVYTSDSFKRVHLGAKMDDIDFLKNKRVRDANIKLIKEQIKHAVTHFSTKEYLKKIVDFYTKAGDKEIVAPYASVIEVVGNNYQLGEERKKNLLNYFIKGGDTRRSGIFNAITEELQEYNDADVRAEGEVIAFNVLIDFDKIEAEAAKGKFSAN